MGGYSLGSFLRLQIKLSSLLKPNHIRECMQQLEDGHQRPLHENVAYAIDFLQNTRAMCAGDAQYLSLLRDLLSERSHEAVRLIDDYVESQGDSRNETLPFCVSEELNYWREDGCGDARAFNSMLMRLYDRIGPTNLRIMVATSPLNVMCRDAVVSVEQFFGMLCDMGAFGPDNLQLLVDWCVELGMEACLLDLIEYWSSSGESSSLRKQKPMELPANSRQLDDMWKSSQQSVRMEEPIAGFAPGSTVSVPRSLRYADHPMSTAVRAGTAAVSSVQEGMSTVFSTAREDWQPRLEETVARSRETPGTSVVSSAVQHADHRVSSLSLATIAKEPTEVSIPTEMRHDTRVSSGQGSTRLPDRSESAVIVTAGEPMSSSNHSNTTAISMKQLPDHQHRHAENQLYPSLEEFMKQDKVNDKTDLKGKKRQLISTEISRSHPKRIKDRETHRSSDYQKEEIDGDSDSSDAFESANDSVDEHEDNESESTQAQAQQIKQRENPASGASIDSKSRHDKHNRNGEIECEERNDEGEDDGQHESELNDEDETSIRDEDNPSNTPAVAASNKTSRFQQFLGGMRSYLGWK